MHGRQSSLLESIQTLICGEGEGDYHGHESISVRETVRVESFYKAPFTREQLLHGCTFLQNVPCVKGQQCFYCPSSLAESCQTLLHFTTMLKLSMESQLNCCHVNSTENCVPAVCSIQYAR